MYTLGNRTLSLNEIKDRLKTRSLCNRCSHLVSKSKECISARNPCEGHDVRIEDVESAAGKGCPICEIIIHRSPREFLTSQESKAPWIFRHISHGDHLVLFLLSPPSNLPLFDGLHQDHITLELEFLDKSSNATSNAQVAAIYEYPGCTSSEHIVHLSKSWLKECDEGHEKCTKKVSNSNYLPPRLLDVSNDDVTLINTIELLRPIDFRYVTLSHCWGSKDFTILTRENEEAFQRQIPLQLLPPNFRDAIDFCRRSNFQFLWIDSLCILQKGEGSEKDWLKHVEEMKHIYRNCYLNISAALSPHAQEGLYCTRDLHMLKPRLIEYQEGGELPNGTYLLVHNLVEHSGWKRSPVNMRGWVLQERLLSPRTLYFTSSQVYWHCSTKHACETYPVDMNVDFSSTRSRAKLPEVSEFSKIDRTSLSITYAGLVEQYTALQLSFPDKDKLPAFAAIAEALAQVSKDRYIAGFFQSQLPEILIWENTNSQAPPRTPRTVYRGPSWSWIKKDLRVDLEYFSYLLLLDTDQIQRFVDIVDVKIALVNNDDTFGRIQSAELVVNGLLLPFRWDRSLPWFSYWTHVNDIDVNQPESPLGADAFVLNVQFDDFGGIVADQETTFVLPIYGFRLQEYRIHCLLLQKSCRDGEDVYERIGIVMCQVIHTKDVGGITDSISQLPRQDIVLI